MYRDLYFNFSLIIILWIKPIITRQSDRWQTSPALLSVSSPVPPLIWRMIVVGIISTQILHFCFPTTCNMSMGVCGECAAHMGGFVAHRRKRVKSEVFGQKWSFWSKMKSKMFAFYLYFFNFCSPTACKMPMGVCGGCTAHLGGFGAPEKFGLVHTETQTDRQTDRQADYNTSPSPYGVRGNNDWSLKYIITNCK